MATFSEVFKGFMRNGIYVLDECPYCGAASAARFTGGFSLFECPECNELTTYESFIKDMANDVVYAGLVDSMNAPKPPNGIIDIATYVPNKNARIVIPSGFNALDRLIGGFRGTELTILTGKRSEGKSTIAGQLALNARNAGHKVFFYSGELSADAFQDWLFVQAAGSDYLNRYIDEFGETRYEIEREYAEPHIRNWLKGHIALYDNRIVDSSESNTIIDRARVVKDYYGSELFFVDNLKTARFKKDSERDHFRKQANFAADMLAFANEHNVHVVLVAHPKKEDTGDANDNVSGLSDITDIAHNVITIKRLDDEKRLEAGYDAVLDVSKSRKHGRVGKFKLDFDIKSKRFIMQNSTNIERYNWEQEI